jgi:hypothetical protein
MLTVRCPRCAHDMCYEPKGLPAGKKKRCVYCGMTFSVHTDLERTRVVCEGKRVEPNTALF